MTQVQAARSALGALALSVSAANVTMAQQAPGGITTIGRAARAAAERATSVLIARERVAQADARVRQARGALLPSITGLVSDGERTLNSASFGFSIPNPATGQPLLDPNGQVLGPVKTWDLRASIRTSLADPAALARLGVVKAGAEASEAEMHLTAQQAATNAALVYVSAMRAEALHTGRAADTALAADLLGIARAQLSAGTGIALDVTRAEAQLAIARAQLSAASTGRLRSRIELARAVGEPLTTAFLLEDLLAERGRGTPGDPASALPAARANRADLRAVAVQLLAAERQVRAVRAERLPSIAAFADDGATGKSTNRLLNTWSWGVQAHIPVFDGFRREGRIAEQRAAIREIEARRRDLLDQVDADIQVAFLELAAAETQVAAALERQRLATQEVAQARDRFSSGVSGNADVILASQNMNAARTFLVDARASHLLAQVMLARAQGTVTQLP